MFIGITIMLEVYIGTAASIYDFPRCTQSSDKITCLSNDVMLRSALPLVMELKMCESQTDRWG